MRVNRKLVLTAAAICMLLPHLSYLYTLRQYIQVGASDFKAFYTGAVMLRSNGGAGLYDYAAQARIQNQLFPASSIAGQALPYIRPPYELLLFLPLAGLAYLPAYCSWVVFTLGLVLVSGKLVGRRLKHLSACWKPMPYALVLCLFPFARLLLMGQDSMLAFLILVACWLSLRRGLDARAGFFLGLGLFKFQIFIPLTAILAIWRPRLLKGFWGGGIGVALISLLMVHPDGIRSYFELLAQMAQDSAAASSARYGMHPSDMPNLRGLVYSIAQRTAALLQSDPATVSVVILTAGSVITLAWAARQMRAIRQFPSEAADLAFALALPVSLFLSFHLVPHDLTLLALPFALVLNWLLRPEAKPAARQLLLIGMVVLFYVTVFHLLLMQHNLVYLLGVFLIACAILISKELSHFGSSSGQPSLSVEKP